MNPRNNANVAAGAMAQHDILGYGTCPLRQKTLQLVPLRYGLVEHADPGAAFERPYALKSRPVGVRLLRDGWLYVVAMGSSVDKTHTELHEYCLTNGIVSALHAKGTAISGDARPATAQKPLLVFPRSSRLYVAYAEVQWSASKCNLVLASNEDREHVMQPVDLGPVDCLAGGKHLLTRAQVERGLAEVAENDELLPVADEPLPEVERYAYLWEHPRQFREAHIGELVGRIAPRYEQDSLFLIVRDDLGVLRDLANHQDAVVSWIDAWAEGENNQRDYGLACYIESLGQIDDQRLNAELQAMNEYSAEQLLIELETFPDPQRQQIRRQLLAYFNQGGQPPMPPEGVPAALEAQRWQAVGKAPWATGDGAAYAQIVDYADRNYFARQAMAPAPEDFIERHFRVVSRLGKIRHQRMIEMLEGSTLGGKRGVNDLIDRPAMDATLHRHRTQLTRWNDLLDRITADRVLLITQSLFQRAGWCYDASQYDQAAKGLSAQYACYKDLCRSDEASAAIFEWLQANPQFDQLLLHTLSRADQAAFAAQLATFNNAGVGLLNNANSATEELLAIIRGFLPQLEKFWKPAQAIADAVQKTLAPAISLGIAKALEGFPGQQLPSLDELFRHLPSVLPARLLQAARAEGVGIEIGTQQDLDAVRGQIGAVGKHRAELKKLNHQRELLKTQPGGHQTPKAKALQADITRLRAELTYYENLLARSLSPLGELPDTRGTPYQYPPGRPALRLVFPAADVDAVRGAFEHAHKGYRSTAPLAKVGDAAAGLLFFAQAVNAWVVFKGIAELPEEEQQWSSLGPSLAATVTAGFAAIQGISDNALKARLAQMAEALQLHALKGVQVYLGKLHVGLGAGTYLAGFAVSAMNVSAHHDEWLQAVRSGNRDAQRAAVASLAGSAGQTLAYGYGSGHTGLAAYRVLTAKDSAARAAVWATSGLRLSSVFMRVNVVGALFTLLELVGTWFYNRYNTSGHDKWLQSTPWGRDADLRKDLPLADYQHALASLLMEPSVQIAPLPKDYPWWHTLIMGSGPGDIHLLLPGLTFGEQCKPLLGASPYSLSLAACHLRASPMRKDGSQAPVTWTVVTEELQASIRLVNTAPLVLCVRYPEPKVAQSPGEHDEMVFVVCVQTTNERGEAQQKEHFIRFDPRQKGSYTPSSPTDIPDHIIPMTSLHVSGELLLRADHA